MAYTCFDVSVDGGVAHLKLNRPAECNAMNVAFWEELPRLMDQIESTEGVRVLVISSTGAHFTSGMDLGVFGSGEALSNTTAVERERLYRLVLKLQAIFGRFERCRFPVIAAIQGGCIGAAVDMVTACDMRYATNDAYFCIQEINLGIMADLGTLQRLPGLIPEGVARELAYTGDKLPAERARSIGLVNEVFDSQEAMLDHVLSVARKIALQSPTAVTATKDAINYVRDHTVAEALEWAARWQPSIISTRDIMEGVKARKEKRAAEFAELHAGPLAL